MTDIINENSSQKHNNQKFTFQFQIFTNSMLSYSLEGHKSKFCILNASKWLIYSLVMQIHWVTLSPCWFKSFSFVCCIQLSLFLKIMGLSEHIWGFKIFFLLPYFMRQDHTNCTHKFLCFLNDVVSVNIALSDHTDTNSSQSGESQYYISTTEKGLLC